MPPRWCVCEAVPPVECPVEVGVVFHRREQWRPTSTGRLIQRVYQGARAYLFVRSGEGNPFPDEGGPARTAWVLHPRGEPLSPELAQSVDPGRLRVLLLDGSWAETGRMLRGVERWGRPVALHLPGNSRYWLRDQVADGSMSTVEALMGLLRAIGQESAAARLGLHLELMVYASLRARGQRDAAAQYLEVSPIRSELPELLERLHARRPNPSLPRRPV